MNQLSVVIITLNEERNIKRALSSVQAIADEIVVVDSGSTDRTKEICTAFGVRFIETEWKGYAQTKNYGHELCKHDWILSLDADEELDERLIAAVKSAKKNGLKGCYVMNRLTNYCGKWIKHSGWYPDKKIRIFNRTEAEWTGEYVHEELIFHNETSRVDLAGHLNHYSYYDYDDHRARADKYSKLTAQKMHAKGKKVSVLKPYISAIGRFISMYIIKLGFLDGWAGFKIAQISAKSNIFNYQELIRLNKGHEKN